MVGCQMGCNIWKTGVNRRRRRQCLIYRQSQQRPIMVQIQKHPRELHCCVLHLFLSLQYNFRHRHRHRFTFTSKSSPSTQRTIRCSKSTLSHSTLQILIPSFTIFFYIIFFILFNLFFGVNSVSNCTIAGGGTLNPRKLI